MTRLKLLIGGACAALASASTGHAATNFNYSGGVQNWLAPVSGHYDIVAYGAQGGGSYMSAFQSQFTLGKAGGLGAGMGGDFHLAAGDLLDIVVGGRGGDTYNGFGSSGGGGGGSFVIQEIPGGRDLLLAAGGGGGTAYNSADSGIWGFEQNVEVGLPGWAGQSGTGGGANRGAGGSPGFGGQAGELLTAFSADPYYSVGAGGAGYYTLGIDAPYTTGPHTAQGGGSPYYGYYGGLGADAGNGGFGGGGGGGYLGGGGGGGYSGGGGGNGAYKHIGDFNERFWSHSGGGGGSFDAGAPILAASGVWTGDGFIQIFLISTDPTASVPEPATWALMLAGFGLVGARLRRRPMTAA